jgi:Xaa-Pro aminopeptidase
MTTQLGTELTGWREKDDRNIKEMRAYMGRERLDAFIPWKAQHIAYLTNYYDEVHTGIQWQEMTALLVIPKESNAFIVGSCFAYVGREGDGVAPSWLTERHEANGAQATFDTTVALLGERGLDRGRIGFEPAWMPVAVHDHLRSALPNVEFVPADLLIPQIRFIKTRREQALLRKAVEAGYRAMEAYMQAIRAKATIHEAARIRAQRCLDYGAEWVGGPYLSDWGGSLGMTPAWWDAPAREQYMASFARLRNWRGLPHSAEIVATHVQTRFQGYWCDAVWREFRGPQPGDDDTVDFGVAKVSYREARRDFEILRTVQTEALQEIRPGMDQHQATMAVDEYLAANADAAQRLTIYYIHGIGLEIHEEPTIRRSSPRVWLDSPIHYYPGAVVSSEWFTNLWGVEDPFVMTETGWEPLAELRDITDPAAAWID